MHRNFIASIAIFVIVAVAGLGCSILRSRRALTWRLTLQVETSASNRSAAVARTISVIETRLNSAHVPRYEVSQDNAASDRIIVNLPTVPDHERLKNLIIAGGKLELFHVVSVPSPMPVRTYDTKEEALALIRSMGDTHTNHSVLPYTEQTSASTKWVIVEHPPIIDGADLRNAQASSSHSGEADNYQISFSLNKTGAEKFGTWTGAHINEYIGVALNDEVKSVAFIRGQISDSGEITGRFTKQSAEDLALVLRSGALPAPIKIVGEAFFSNS